MQDSCDGSNLEFYRQEPTKIAYNTVIINPTFISGNTERVICKYQLVNTGSLQIVVNDVLGREIFRQNIQPIANDGSYEILANLLETGMNIIRVHQNNKCMALPN